MTVLYALGGVAGLAAALVGMLYALRRCADRMRREPSTMEQPENMPAGTPALLAAPEPISEQDRIHQEEDAALSVALAADREFFARLGRIVDRRFAGIDARARRAFGPAIWDEAAAWAQIDTGEYSLVGAA